MLDDRIRMQDRYFSADSRGALPDAVQNSEAALRIRLLGRFRVLAENRVISDQAWRLRKASHLIKLLALTPDHRMHREQVLDYLWPDLAPAAAGNNLRVTLHAARRTLEPDSQSTLLRLESNQLSLASSDSIWVDVRAFEAAADVARGSGDLTAYQRALDLYGGDLLPDDPYEDWIIERRESFRELYLALLTELAARYEQVQELELAIETRRRILASDPIREDAHTGLMRLYARSGQRHQALRQYEILHETLRRELNIEPDATSSRIYEDIIANRVPPYPVTPSVIPNRARERAQTRSSEPDGRQTNLPAQLTSFIGREQETADISGLFNERRLITLTGPGGSGKTRLALQVARGLVANYSDGVWFVDLAGLSDPAMVPQVVASCLGIRQEPETTMIRTIGDVLSTQRLLLILDNCEHLITSCAMLVDHLLRAAPGLHVLATSREPLRVPGETVRPVPALESANIENELPLEQLHEVDAIRLFTERVRLNQPEFMVNEHNALAVTRICSGLEGIPLAIELAAARTRTLPVDQIASRLHEALHLLSGGSRTAPERHQTLRATIEWSWVLLSGAERQLMQRLAVFSGGCTIDTAERICTGDGIESTDVLTLLFQLVDKSLVLVEEPEGETRYRLLETIRQFALERFRTREQAARFRQHHADYFLSLAEMSLPELRGPDAATWNLRLSQELDNMRAALWFLIESDSAEQGLHLGWALWRFWASQGHLTEGRRWLSRLLAMDDVGIKVDPRMKALFAAGRLAYLQGDYAGARPTFEQGLQLATELDDRVFIAGCLVQLGYVSLREGAYDAARGFYEKGLAIRRELGENWYIAVAVVGLGQTALAQAAYDEARALFEEGYALYKEAGDRTQVARPLALLGQLAYYQGALPRARELLEESLAIWQMAGYKRGMAMAFASIGHVAAAKGNAARANAMFAESRTLYQELGIKRDLSDTLEWFNWPPLEA